MAITIDNSTTSNNTKANIALVNGEFVVRATPSSYDDVDKCYIKFGERFDKIRQSVDAFAKDDLMSTAYKPLVMYLQDEVARENTNLIRDIVFDLDHARNNDFDELRISNHERSLAELEFKVLILNCVGSFKELATSINIHNYI